jgi:hypothetical protein
MSGSLLQLVTSTGSAPAQYIGPSARSTSINAYENDIHAFEYVEKQFDGTNHYRHIQITRDADTCTPSYIIINTNNPMTPEQFITNIGNSRFKMEIGGQQIFENRVSLYIDLGLFRQLDPVTFSVGIPYSQYNDDIYLIALQYMEVRCFLDLDTHDFIDECSIILEYKYLSHNNRLHMASNGHEHYLQLFQSSYTELTQPTNIITQNLPFDLISKGLLISTDINNISSIQLKLNGTNRWNYNSTMLKLYSQQIGPGIFYIPFSSKIGLFDKAIHAYRSGLNFTRIDYPQLTINFIQPVTKLGVHSLFFNILRTMSGMTGLAFSACGNIITFTTNMPMIYNINPTVKPSNYVWKRINKILLGIKNTDCPITYNPINKGAEYCTCDTCKYNFSKAAFIDSCEYYKNYKCPMCKSPWTDWTIYINVDPTLSKLDNDENIQK